MSILSREAAIGTFGRSDEWNGIGGGFSHQFEIAVWAACLAVAIFVPDGYPQLVAFSVLSLCSFASIVRVCQGE